MTDEKMFARRLYTQHVIRPPLASPEEIVGQLGAAQSQDYPGAKWSLGQRVEGCSDADIDEAFNASRILRTHVMRPTWHFVLPTDIRWLLELTAPRVQALNAYMYRKLELDEKTLGRSLEVIAEAVKDGNFMTRVELGKRLGQSGIDASGMRLGYIAMNAELERLICSGPLEGKQHTYGLIEERAPQAASLDRDEALAEIARRFFIGHGPGTVDELARWSGLTMRDAKAAQAAIESELVSENWGDLTFWSGPEKASIPSLAGTALLLPEYDEALIAYKHYYFDNLPHAAGKEGWSDNFYRPIIIDGKRAGTWRRTVKGKKLVFDANLFADLSKEQEGVLSNQVERLRKFLDLLSEE